MSKDAERGFWEQNASRYDASMLLLGGPIPKAVQLTAKAVRGAGRVLEVACGTGLFTEALAPVVGELVATDYAEAMVQRTQQRLGDVTNVQFMRRDVMAFDDSDGLFDAVVASNVLHLLPDLVGGLAAIRRVLRPGGLLITPTYCHDQTPLSRLASSVLGVLSFPAHRRFRLDSLGAAVEAAKFTVTHSELVKGLLPIGFVLAARPLGGDSTKDAVDALIS
ncbi:class I SAM-dependent methyltransferase [Myxococcota bacterium]|nr:class I SAM-dependent methyltransferase [Myxococcota bacterium]